MKSFIINNPCSYFTGIAYKKGFNPCNDFLTMKKKRRIYTDTSTIGGCFDPEFSYWSNCLFKDFKNGIYQPVTSEIVAQEIQNAPPQVVQKYLELFNYQIEIVHITNIVVELADLYLAKNILTLKHYNDATHIALASIYEVDILTSWNFRHIVHLDKIPLFNAVNLEQGYKMLSIQSPKTITTSET